MISSQIYVRIVEADRQRGYSILVGYDPKVVQRTAIQQVSLSVLTKANLEAAFERIKQAYHTSDLRDVTDSSIKKRLDKLFAASELAQETPTA